MRVWALRSVKSLKLNNSESVEINRNSMGNVNSKIKDAMSFKYLLYALHYLFLSLQEKKLVLLIS